MTDPRKVLAELFARNDGDVEIIDELAAAIASEAKAAITPDDIDKFTDEQFTAFMHASGFDARIDAALAEAHVGQVPVYRRAEATAAAEQGLRARIEALPRMWEGGYEWVHRAAVLELVSGGSPATPVPTGATAHETPPTGYPAPAASPRQGEPVDVERLDRALGSLEEDDLDYDYPVAMSGEPLDPVLFVRYDALRAALSEPAEAAQKEETP